MYLRHSAKYGKAIKIIHPGEFYVTAEDELIGTLLGSCVSVCLIDRVNKIAGMNHFMLPGRITSSDIFTDKSARYGINAINQLLLELKNKKSDRKKLVAKVFGGGHVLESNLNGRSIPDDNIRLAMVMLEMEDIPIESTDVGEDFTRKLLLEVSSGDVFLKKTTRKDIVDVISQREIEYAQRSFDNE